MGIRENLVRVAAGIEAVEDIMADLNAALRAI
jgi:cystathionine beta-lyase/cystathionine gamma-synthase